MMDSKIRSDGDLDAGYGDGYGGCVGVEANEVDDLSYGTGKGFGGGSANNYRLYCKGGFGRGGAAGAGYADGTGKG